ncbi:MAG: TRAP transporter substrate-binding protein DctP [Proteobacteria bacterium]|jgi:TRAP-type mannitol/chloroaromatic compound transport system substrate-binding protein|nr:TRAP transporter substrate-binding protein DctP [Pseudomonadota bacterium]
MSSSNTSSTGILSVIIVVLLGALVTVSGLYIYQRAADYSPAQIEQPSDGADFTASQVYEWRLVTTWPKNYPAIGLGPENFAKMVERMSNGRLIIQVYGAGEIVPALGVFDAVSNGSIEMGHGAAYYWKGKIPASTLFTTLPFGMNAQEVNGWIHYGGGLELWRETYKPFGLIPFAGGNTGVQMAGWFNKEINSVEDLQGLKMRIPGLAGEVFTLAGGSSVTIPGGELYTSMQTGVIDATEWVGPYNDIAFGLHEVAEHYYYTGWHEPGPMLEFIVNEAKWNTLPADLQAIIGSAARVINHDVLDEYTAKNAIALQDLKSRYGIIPKPFPPEVLDYLREIAEQRYLDLAAQDEQFSKVYSSYKTFLDSVSEYHEISEKWYYTSRSFN